MKLEHAFFVKIMNDYFRNHPEHTIGQALKNLEVNQSIHVPIGVFIKDNSKEDDSDVVNRMGKNINKKFV